MGLLDLFIVFGYLVGITLFGIWFAGKQETTADYFVGDRSVPWWAIAASIVATETSTITFISVPGVAFARGGNFQFLQLVFGYMLGRIVISFLFIPSYFRGELLTVYQLLERRFGGRIKMLAAALFVVMRNIADGIRLLLTAIVLAAVYVSFQSHSDASTVTTATGASIVLLGVVMIFFTYYGGMEAVIWVEVVQLGIYLAGALAAAVVIAASVKGGFGGAIELGKQFAKFDVIDFGLRQTPYALSFPFTDATYNFTLPLDLTKSYTFWAGLVGGCFLTMSTHGTDQYLVQRYLCTDRPRSAALALLSSGIVVLAQFVGFLFIGVLLFAFYRPDRIAGGGPAAPFHAADQVFPDFITRHLPSGLSGLVVAAIFAAAMSSSLNSIAAAFTEDLYKPFVPRVTDRHILNVSRIVTIVAGAVQIVVGPALRHQNESALSTALGVASLINGPVLGIFLLGSMRRGGGGPPPGQPPGRRRYADVRGACIRSCSADRSGDRKRHRAAQHPRRGLSPRAQRQGLREGVRRPRARAAQGADDARHDLRRGVADEGGGDGAVDLAADRARESRARCAAEPLHRRGAERHHHSAPADAHERVAAGPRFERAVERIRDGHRPGGERGAGEPPRLRLPLLRHQLRAPRRSGAASLRRAARRVRKTRDLRAAAYARYGVPSATIAAHRADRVRRRRDAARRRPRPDRPPHGRRGGARGALHHRRRPGKVRADAPARRRAA